MLGWQLYCRPNHQAALTLTLSQSNIIHQLAWE